MFEEDGLIPIEIAAFVDPETGDVIYDDNQIAGALEEAEVGANGQRRLNRLQRRAGRVDDRRDNRLAHVNSRFDRKDGRIDRKIDRLEDRFGIDGDKADNKEGWVDRYVTGTQTTAASSVGQAVSFTFTPKTSMELEEIYAAGDTGATITGIQAGDTLVVADSIAASLLAASSLKSPKFHGKFLQAGVPVTVNYLAGSTSALLQLTFKGKGPPPRC